MDTSAETMKLIGPVLLLFAALALGLSYESVDYVLHTIEYLISVKSGVFYCIFYDIASTYAPGDELDAILNSPLLEGAVKYIINDGFDRAMLQDFPWDPELLLVRAGNNLTHLQLEETENDIVNVLFSFNPSTKILVLVDNLSSLVSYSMLNIVHYMNFTSSVFVDSASSRVWQMNGEIVSRRPKQQHPMFLFSWNRRWYKGRSIVYMRDGNDLQFVTDYHWVNETARYLNTVLVQYPMDCESTKRAARECMDLMHDSSVADIMLMHMFYSNNLPRDFSHIFTNYLMSARIAVPRDRPLNIAELLTMPFSWQVWALLVTVFVISEIVKRTNPKHFRNDPILLAVCGYERHDLHHAGWLEKITFLSLIVFVFFMSNAFETKIISLMVNKPSIQRIKTLEDFFASGLKLGIDEEGEAHFVNHSFFGKFVTFAEKPELLEIAPGVALYWGTDFVELFLDYKFDYERMQPYYVLLDYVHISDPEMYLTSLRSIFRDTFRYIHAKLVEAGLMDLWKRQAKDQKRLMYIGKRPRMNISEKVVLNFDDILPAWIMLGIGLCVSVVGFVGEHVWKLF